MDWSKIVFKKLGILCYFRISQKSLPNKSDDTAQSDRDVVSIDGSFADVSSRWALVRQGFLVARIQYSEKFGNYLNLLILNRQLVYKYLTAHLIIIT